MMDYTFNIAPLSRTVSLEEEILKRIKPTPEEEKEIMDVAEDLVERSLSIISEMGIDAEPIIVGSVAKGTFLKNPDIDIFIRFPPETPREEMERLGIEIGRAIIPDGRENYAEHPYIHGVYRGFEVDIVPCYRIEDGSKKMSAVDRTPFHTEYIKSHISEEQKDEVRLLKRFMKGIGVYGAEAEIEGFSGYLTELLIIYYGSFMDVIKASQRWKRGTRLSLEEDKGNRFDDSLIFIDPVDPKRNVASALSVDSFALFIYAAHEYLSKADERFFFPKKREAASYEEIRAEIERKGTEIIGFEIDRPDLVHDVLFPQIKKAKRTVAQRLNDAGFTVLSSTYKAYDDKITFIYELEVHTLPSVKKHYGPPVWHPNSENFLKKWKNIHKRIEMGRWVVQIPREDRDALSYLKRTIPDANLGKDLTEIAKKSFRVLSRKDIIHEHAMLITEMLFPLFPWQI